MGPGTEVGERRIDRLSSLNRRPLLFRGHYWQWNDRGTVMISSAQAFLETCIGVIRLPALIDGAFSRITTSWTHHREPAGSARGCGMQLANTKEADRDKGKTEDKQDHDKECEPDQVQIEHVTPDSENLPIINSADGWVFAFEGGAHILFRYTASDARFVRRLPRYLCYLLLTTIASRLASCCDSQSRTNTRCPF
jgi:hypothetical protein